MCDNTVNDITTTDNDYSEMKLEDLMQELDCIMNTLESGNAPLEEAFDLYHKGMILLKECNSKIDGIEKKMIILQNGEENEF